MWRYNKLNLKFTLYEKTMLKKKPLKTVFSCGFLSGILMSCIFVSLFDSKPKINQDKTWDLWRGKTESSNLFMDVPNKKTESHTNGTYHDESTHNLSSNQTSEYSYKQKGEEVAKELYNQVQVLCWVATMPQNHVAKAAVIRDTWGKRCNVLLFMSSAEDSSLPAVKLNVSEGRAYLFDKTKEAMKYVYKYYIEKVDWILKADDDTFVVVENLRKMLSQFNPSEPLYLGCRFKPFAKQGFMSGGAGYVLSKEALRTLVEKGIGSNGRCSEVKETETGEDVLLGKCLEAVNVTAADSRDERGRGRFFPYDPAFHLFPDHYSSTFQWYWNYQYYPDPEGLDCCSDTAVSFHYIEPNQLQILDYLIYTLHPYGTFLYNQNKTSIVINL